MDVSVQVQNYNLDLVASGNGTAQTSGSYALNSEVTITAIADPDNEFINWTDDSGTEFSGDASYTFNMPANNLRLYANFQEVVNLCNLYLEVSPPSSGIVSGSGSFPCGEEVTVRATPSTNYIFLNWEDLDLGLELPDGQEYTFNLEEDKTLVANFEFQICPPGYSLVPGNSFYNTDDFCVMKWEGRYNSGSGHIGNYPVYYHPDGTPIPYPYNNCYTGYEDYSYILNWF